MSGSIHSFWSRSLAWLAGLALVLGASAAFAQGQGSPKGKLEDDLLKELTDGLGLDDLPAKPAPKAVPAPAPKTEAPATRETSPKSEPPANEDAPADPPARTLTPPSREVDLLRQQLLKELTTDLEPDDNEDPLLRIGQRMKQVEDLISRRETGQDTQDLQGEILSDLDQLLAQLKKQCQACNSSGNSSPSPSQKSVRSQPKSGPTKPGSGQEPGKEPGEQQVKAPGQESTNRIEKGTPEKSVDETRDARALTDLVKAIWGQLPERDREMMIQGFRGRYLPSYEGLIEDYFDRLAKQRSPGGN